MSDVYFVNILIQVVHPHAQRIIIPGKRKVDLVRHFEASLPVRDKVRAEQLMDHFAKSLAEIFKEVEDHDASRRQAAQEISEDSGRDDPGRGDHLPAANSPSHAEQIPGGEGGDSLGTDLPARANEQDRADKKE